MNSNPFVIGWVLIAIWALSASARGLHEALADEEALQNGTIRSTYANTEVRRERVRLLAAFFGLYAGSISLLRPRLLEEEGELGVFLVSLIVPALMACFALFGGINSELDVRDRKRLRFLLNRYSFDGNE